MIKHIVAWKLKDGDKEQNAQKVKATIESLKSKIPQVKHIEVGINFEKSDAAYDIVLYSEFASVEDLDIYQKHPEHVAAAGFVKSVVSTRVVVDYKTA